jgi:Ion channel
MTFFAPPRSDAASARERRERFGLVLCGLVIAFAVQGVAEPSAWEQVVVSALLAATLLLSFSAANVRPRFMRWALVIAILMFAVSVAGAVTGHVDSAAARLSNLLLVTLAPPALIVGIVRSLRSRNQVTLEAVFGVLCLYILFGMFFAFVYGAIGRLTGRFFAEQDSTSVAHCLYFSFTTLTTVGYGDLTAASNLGHTLSVTEALSGQIYLVTVVSVIVGNLGRRRSQG